MCRVIFCFVHIRLVKITFLLLETILVSILWFKIETESDWFSNNYTKARGNDYYFLSRIKSRGFQKTWFGVFSLEKKQCFGRVTRWTLEEEDNTAVPAPAISSFPPMRRRSYLRRAIFHPSGPHRAPFSTFHRMRRHRVTNRKMVTVHFKVHSELATTRKKNSLYQLINNLKEESEIKKVDSNGFVPGQRACL